MFLPLFVLAASAKLVASSIQDGEEELLEPLICTQLNEHRVYVTICPAQEDPPTVRTCHVLESSPKDKLKHVSEQLKAYSATERVDAVIYVRASKESNVQSRLGPFIELVNEKNLAGMFWSVKCYVKEKATVHGPSETIKWAINTRRTQFIGCSVPGLILNLNRPEGEQPKEVEDPKGVIRRVFDDLSKRVSNKHLNIVVWPELFFNIIYYTGSESGLLVNNDVVEEILSCHGDYFGRVSNVISVLSFLHGFHVRETPEWLSNWERPSSWEPAQKKVLAGDQHSSGIFDDHDFHVANYQLFIWNQEKLAVYRKTCYSMEFTWGQKYDVSCKFTFEFGNWKAAIIAKSGLSGQVTEALFGKDGCVIPRICCDIVVIRQGIDVEQERKKNPGEEDKVKLNALMNFRNQIKTRGILLVTGADASSDTLSHVCDHENSGKPGSEQVTGVLLDCYSFTGEFNVRGAHVEEHRTVALFSPPNRGGIKVAVLRLSQRSVRNTVAKRHSKKMRHKELRAAVSHLIRFISRRFRARHRPDNVVCDFAFSKKRLKRMRYKELKATLYHLSKFLYCHHKRHAVLGKLCTMLRCAKGRHKRVCH